MDSGRIVCRSSRFTAAGESAKYDLIPMYQIRDQRYSIYWQTGNSKPQDLACKKLIRRCASAECEQLRIERCKSNEVPTYCKQEFRSCVSLNLVRAIPILLILSGTVGIPAQMPGQKAPGPPPAQVEQTSHGIRATAGSEVLEVTVCTDSVIHVVATPEPSAPASPRPWMLDAPAILPRSAVHLYARRESGQHEDCSA